MRYHAFQFSDKTDIFDFLGPNLPRNGFWGQNFKNLSLDSNSSSLRYYVHLFSEKTDNLNFWAQKWNLASEFQKSKSGFTINTTPPIYRACQFWVKMNNFLFFSLNLGKLPNYMQHFGPNNVEGVAESWVEAEMSWVEVDGAWWSSS